MPKQNSIILYADDFTQETWKEYCRIANVPLSAQMIAIYFNDNNVIYRE